jgi:hypothetical protein
MRFTENCRVIAYFHLVLADSINSWRPSDAQNVWELSGLHEGDIMIHPDSPSWKNGLLDATARWPAGVVPYFIEENDFGNLLSPFTQ